MNWDAVSAIAEVIGLIAIVVSLIYVSIQIRQNTMMMRSSAKQSLTDATQGLIYKAMDHSTEWVKLISGDEPATPEEEARMSLLVRAMLRGFESQCYQYDAGLLEDAEWTALKQAIRDICGLPGVNRYWQTLRPHMSARLRDIVDGE